MDDIHDLHRAFVFEGKCHSNKWTPKTSWKRHVEEERIQVARGEMCLTEQRGRLYPQLTGFHRYIHSLQGSTGISTAYRAPRVYLQFAGLHRYIHS